MGLEVGFGEIENGELKNMKQFLSKVIRDRKFYYLWKKLNELSYYGMNFGVASGYANYSGELYIIKKVKNYVSGGVIFDVGANVGEWSKFVMNEYEDMRYNLFLFEPSLATFNKLKENIKSRENVTMFPIGFGDKAETLKLFYNNETQGSASILKKGKYFEDIQIETIDNFCKENNISTIDFLKMDVQGYEYNILIGAKRMLSEGRIKFIQFEFDEPNIENRIFFKDFWQILSNDFDIYQSLYNGLIKIERYDYTLENFRCMNYLAVSKGINFNL